MSLRKKQLDEVDKPTVIKEDRKKIVGKKNGYTDNMGRKQSQLEILPQLYYQDLPRQHKALSVTENPFSFPELQCPCPIAIF